MRIRHSEPPYAVAHVVNLPYAKLTAGLLAEGKRVCKCRLNATQRRCLLPKWLSVRQEVPSTGVLSPRQHEFGTCIADLLPTAFPTALPPSWAPCLPTGSSEDTWHGCPRRRGVGLARAGVLAGRLPGSRSPGNLVETVTRSGLSRAQKVRELERAEGPRCSWPLTGGARVCSCSTVAGASRQGGCRSWYGR